MNQRLRLLAFGLPLALTCVAQRPMTPPRAVGAGGGFESNRGQARHDVRFLAWRPGVRTELRADGASVSWRDERGAPARTSVRFVGADRASRATGRQELRARSPYYVGNDPTRWVTDVPHFETVEYAGVYPGVDVVFRGAEEGLRYDFVVAPGADPTAIGLEFDGATGLRVDGAGDLLIGTPAGELR